MVDDNPFNAAGRAFLLLGIGLVWYFFPHWVRDRTPLRSALKSLKARAFWHPAESKLGRWVRMVVILTILFSWQWLSACVSSKPLPPFTLELAIESALIMLVMLPCIAIVPGCVLLTISTLKRIYTLIRRP